MPARSPPRAASGFISSPAAASLTISGYSGGIRVGNGAGSSTATVSNFGTIAATSTAQGYGVEFYGAGAVTNGSTSDTSALITGYAGGLRLGVNSPAPPSTVTNFGTIQAIGTSGGFGISLGDGGNIRNGASNSTAATISGSRYGISDYAGTVTNYGSILGGYGGLRLTGSGPSAVINGASNSTAAVISGQQGVYLFGGTLTNFGLIAGNGSGTSGLSSYFGVQVAADGSVGNFGTIEASGTPANGVTLTNGGTVTNGASNITNALISGANNGIYAHFLAGTVTNFGTIIGTNGIGVYFNGSPSNTLIDRGTIIGGTAAVKFNNTGGNLLKLYPGAVLTGVATAAGTGNVLELASSASAGTISGLGSSFAGFGNIQVDSGAQWTTTGTNSIASGATLTNSGTVSVTGTLSITGSLIDGGTVSGATINSGGTELVLSGGSDLGARISRGEVDVFGTARSDTIFTGSQVVESGGTASSSIVSGGKLIVLSAGIASATTVSSGGNLTISGTASGSTVSGGGVELVRSGGTAVSACRRL